MPPPRPLRVPATDGFPLAATLHEPPHAPPRAAALVLPAMGVPRSFYAEFAQGLARRGFLALTLDYRGVGESRPAPAAARAQDWGERDVAGALAWLAKERAELPRVVVGHSIGGQVLGMAEGARDVAAIAAVASSNPHWRAYPGLLALRRFVEFHALLPLVAAPRRELPAWVLGEPVPRGAALQWGAWARSPRYLFRDDADGAWARRYAEVRAPLLNLGFADDRLAPPRAVDGLSSFYPNAKLERRTVAPAEVGAREIGHFGAFRPRFEATLWAQLADWLDARLA